MNNMKISCERKRRETGAALVTVLMISVVLGIACIAMLTAVGANSRNSTDVLSETKAYYAAESGLQSTINVLRGHTDTTPADTSDDIDYIKADADPDLSSWLPYNYPTTGTPDRVVIGQPPADYTPLNGAAYSVEVTDPDNSSDSLTFNTSGFFLSGGTVSADSKTIYFPNDTAANKIEIKFTDAPSTVHNFTSNPELGRFTIITHGTGAVIPSTTALKFRIDYNLTAPRAAVRSIWGSIKQASSSSPVNATFQSQNYKLLGSSIELCSTTSGGPNCADVSFNLTSTSRLYAYITPVHPYRLKVLSTGYGPNGARKQLEAIIQKNFFNGLNSGAATTMIGTSVTPPGGLPFYFEPGTSNGVLYSGGNCASSVGCVPSFGLTDPITLAYALANPPGPGAGDPLQYQPPPAGLDSNNTPDWQQSPESLDALVDQLRTTAQNSGRYFVNPSGDADNFTVGNNQNPPGSWATGTGITFCEGSCKIGESGGGILVVTGKLTNVGNFSFKGMIIVTGEDGWERNGAGQGQVVGNVIIAPYNKRTYVPENLSSTFLAPRYYITGGGGSDVIYDDVSSTLDNTSAVSDFMLGIAEK